MAVDKDKLQEEASVIRFCKIILGWDFKQLMQEYEGKGRKNSNVTLKEVKDGRKDSNVTLKEVKDTYKDADDYLETFEPLLFEEVKAQIVQRKDSEEAPEWKMRLVMDCSEADGFHFPMVTYEADEDESISPNDFLLLSKSKEEDSSYAFALVEHRQRNLLRLRMYLAEEMVQITKNIKSSRTKPFIQALSNMRALITSSSSAVEKRLFSLKLCSLSTIIREYVGLRSVSSLPFRDLILTTAEQSCGYGDESWKISEPLHEFFKENLNKSQKEAIDVGLSRKSFVLIQGPPGTGKTQTILSILSAILHATPARVQSKGAERVVNGGLEMTNEEKCIHWKQASPWLFGGNPRDAIMPVDGDDGFFPTTGNELKPEVVNASRKYRLRVLVCAPSNSALDEIVLRLLTTGLRDENIQKYTPKIVRIGLKPHHSVMSVSLDHLVAQKRGSAIDKPKQGTTGTDLDSIRTAILDEAAIVFSTLSFSGSALLTRSTRGFDVVIIDEAAQAVEPATLVPLATGCKQVFLVGDPVQLPATVISPIAKEFGYGTSLFKRLQRAGHPVKMLRTQYRMHPEIRSFPSKEFYDEALEDGSDIEAQTNREWHKYRCFGPFCFFDIHEGKESQPPGGTRSWINFDEVEFVLLIYHKLVSMYPELKSSSQLAIISPYSYQVKTFKDRFKDMFGIESAKVVDINTVDGFQGREKDVAIFSCVRANERGEIGFVSDFRRMNVGITRAKSSVLVVGSAATLRNDEHWKNLIQSAEHRNQLFKVSKPFHAFFSDENLNSMRIVEKDVEIPDASAFEDETVPVPVPVFGGGDAEQEQPDEDNYGDGYAQDHDDVD
ncbi:PREDICTED: probable helicase MAGATAMA 3 [Tarenaya hassleriana]|uniref:probable helicase MAGATAMA 3 n=1 Tax=Tarenaya hassleriana TaxID=28532 RepID=UPI00053C967E|nr:PREDICTED: probable helicase MAGATAMA 3 [Tarenaya hassleriana]